MADMHIDQKVLSDLREVMEDGYLQLLETFLEDSERRLSQLHEAKDADELGLAAHSFKGSSSNMGAVGLAELCQQLEERVRQQSLYGIEDLINRIDQEYLEVQRFYRGERQRIAAE
ncbi:Hpt domain-containing protein [Pseudomonas sp. BW16M2]|uniref:Hpt domain-containing protein n=1 Tax=Pseudomonas peradeniyensis TaxID=2745488 RepID=A0ABT2VCJ6_9PSED|nr:MULTISPECIES: Hpt domain-containing protein [unclassified Pseudomonas]MBC3437603.1 Hpt domain-containing protein [Pseudomonas sp. BW16M2]MCU7239333.1 Hpt domain-containing protein [Pseudomonas peradeniyensis]KNX76771.1 histidine kinase [Pseudomonas sp. 250J]MCU7281523.1 Hpt domain-containing protein [Pseudomonas peradeniyensis]QZA55915.1 Hpt domain-containing protein [Pseudomonas sp. 2hn]